MCFKTTKAACLNETQTREWCHKIEITYDVTQRKQGLSKTRTPMCWYVFCCVTMAWANHTIHQYSWESSGREVLTVLWGLVSCEWSHRDTDGMRVPLWLKKMEGSPNAAVRMDDESICVTAGGRDNFRGSARTYRQLCVSHLVRHVIFNHTVLIFVH